jgi:hypothetical protein
MGKLEGGYTAMAKQAEQERVPLPPIPEGAYHAVVTAATHRTSKAGNDSYKVEFTVKSGDYKGRKASKYLTLTERSRAVFFREMDTLGLDVEFWAEIDDEDDPETIVCAELIGARTKLVIGEPKWYGDKPQTNVKSLKRAA